MLTALLLAALALQPVPAGQSPSPPAAATPPAASIQEMDLAAILEPIRKGAELPALWAGIVLADGTTRVACVGVRELRSDAPAQPGDRVHLGSCTKSMTATLCALLVSEGKLRWDLTIAEALPELKDQIHEGYRGVTLAQLLTNRGGVPGDINIDGLWGKLWAHPGPPRAARRVMAEGILSHPPAYEPGSKEVYSNGNFAIAGHIAESVMDQPYEELITAVLFEPLGMSTAGFGAPGSADVIDQPRGHTQTGQIVRPGPRSDNPPAIAPAGTVHVSLEDWGKYLAMHLRGAIGQPQRVGERTLDVATFERLHTPPDDRSPYAYGWVASEREWAGPPGVRRVIWHNGSNTLWYGEATLALEKGFAVMVVTNMGGERAQAAVGEASRAVIKAQNR